MTMSNTIDKRSPGWEASVGKTHNVHNPEHWPTVIFFLMMWVGITVIVWLVSITGPDAPHFEFPIQSALVDFLKSVLRAILEFLKTIPYPG